MGLTDILVLAGGFLLLLLSGILLLGHLRSRAKDGMDVACLTGRGRRTTQQDSIAIAGTEDRKVLCKYGLMAVVADGMGGMAMGDVLSAETTAVCVGVFSRCREHEPAFLLDRMIREAQHRARCVLEENGNKAGGTTAAVVLVRGGCLHYASVGDSRVALVRNRKLQVLNRMHNHGADLDELAKKGMVTAEEAEQDPRRRALTSYIGTEGRLRVDRNKRPIPLAAGDWVLVMSDGMETLSDTELCCCLQGADSAKIAAEAAERLVQKKNRQNQDNYSAVLIRIN